MVGKILKVFKIEFTSIHQAAILLGASALGSQVLGLVRDRMLAGRVGAGQTLDIYYGSFVIPDFIFTLFSSIVSVTVLVPLLAGKFSSDSKLSKEGKEFLNSLFSGFCIVLLVVSVVAFFLVPALSHIVVPGFTEEARMSLVTLTRIMLVSPFLLGLSNLFASITQLERRFIVSSISPVLYNLGIIAGIVFLYPVWGEAGLGAGVIFGALLHFGIQAISVRSFGYKIKFSKISFSQIKDVVLLSMPRTLGLTLQSMVFLVLIAGSSLALTDGGISLFRFSYNLQNVPLSLIGVTYAVAAFPTLSKLYSAQNIQAFTSQVVGAMKSVIFWSLPAIALFVVLRAHIVRVVLGTNSFSWDDTRIVAASLALFVLSLSAQSLTHLLVRGYYAKGDTKTPLKMNSLGAGIAILSSILLVKMYQNLDLFRDFMNSLLHIKSVGGEIPMLALGFSIGAIFSAVALSLRFVRDHRESLPKDGSIRKTIFQSISASFYVGATTYLLLQTFSVVFENNTLLGIFSQAVLSGLGGIIVGFYVLYVLDSNELQNLWVAVRGKFKKPDVQPLSGEGL